MELVSEAEEKTRTKRGAKRRFLREQRGQGAKERAAANPALTAEGREMSRSMGGAAGRGKEERIGLASRFFLRSAALVMLVMGSQHGLIPAECASSLTSIGGARIRLGSIRRLESLRHGSRSSGSDHFAAGDLQKVLVGLEVPDITPSTFKSVSRLPSS
ncbi:hypothetical protein B296_00015108 [Ensete ventricosum]|uniref:Uncharacterized protein n=1 Tax=Ensete ventricosum TaxID=4639 RepID=A0A427AH42_ENSVE|nr:hypothetical protein B296_00015108 [Ensete ventricosum]